MGLEWEKSCWSRGSFSSREASSIVALFFQNATTASGAAKEAIICGTLKALVRDLGLETTDEMIANGCPSEKQ